MKYLKISSILAVIALFCSLVIAGMNMLTSPIVAKNNQQTEYNTIVSIFNTYDKDKSQVFEGPFAEKIESKILAKDKDGNELGFVYTVSGKNAYGIIKLMVAIKDGRVYQVEFLENGQSFASTVDKHVTENYPSSEKKVIELGFKPASSKYEGDLDEDELTDIDI